MKKKFLLIIFIFIISVINVKAIDYLGDVNGDGKVNVTDYVLIRKYLLKLSTLSDQELKRADVNKDGKITSVDYIEIRKIILYKTELVPVITSTPKVTTSPTASPKVTTSPTPTSEAKVAIPPTKELCVSKTYNGTSQQLTSVTSKDGYTLSGYSGTNAGKYTITATLLKGYKWNDNTTKNKTFECSIDKATNNITITLVTKTYNGKTVSTTTNATNGTATVTYYSDAECKTATTTKNASTAGGPPKTAGTYYVNATVDANKNYKAASSGCQKGVVINKATNTVTITSNSYVYDGSGKTTTATATHGTPTITYYSDSSCKTKTTTTNATIEGGTPKIVGTYYAIATVSASTNYNEGNSGCKEAVVISKTKNTVTITSKTYTFDGKGKSTTASATYGTPTITYYSDSTCKTKTTTTNATAEGGTPKYSGTYYAIAKVPAGNDYSASDSGCKKAVVINKANNDVTITSKSYTYDGTEKVTTTSSTAGTPKLTYYSDSSCKTKTTTTNANVAGGAPKTAGTYYAIAIVSAGINYNEGKSGCKKAVVISKASNSVTITSKTYTYDGKGKKTTVNATFGSPTITYYSDSSCKTKTTTTNATEAGGTPKNAGTYYAKAVVKGTANYSDGNSGCKEAVIINKATNVVTITTVTKAYTGSGIATTVSATYGTPTVTYYSDSSCKTKTTTTNATEAGGTPKRVGTFYAKATVSANTNYKAGSSGCKKAVVINKAKNPITVTASQSWDVSPSSKAQTKTITAATKAKGTVTYTIQSQPSGNYFSLSGTTLTMKANTKEGTYKVVIRATAAGNSLYKSGYKDITMTVTVSTISPYNITTDSKYSSYSNIASCSSSTLKYRIVSYKNQDIILIWVKNSTSQLKSALAVSDGTKADSADTILKNEISTYGYSKKCMVATNASFFNMNTGNLNPDVILSKGKIIRDNTGGAHGVIGVNGSGILSEYNSKHSASYLVNAGVLSTFGISSPTHSDKSQELGNRTQICQIDKNNFAMLSGSGRVYNTGEILKEFTGCKRAYNLDGGGSRKLYYKTQSTSTMTRHFGGGRPVPDMLYFVEQ